MFYVGWRVEFYFCVEVVEVVGFGGYWDVVLGWELFDIGLGCLGVWEVVGVVVGSF